MEYSRRRRWSACASIRDSDRLRIGDGGLSERAIPLHDAEAAREPRVALDRHHTRRHASECDGMVRIGSAEAADLLAAAWDLQVL